MYKRSSDHSVLYPLRGEPKRRKIATIDIETRNWNEPYAVGFFDGVQHKDFVDYDYKNSCLDDALRYVLRPEYAGWWIYAHNGGAFDFLFFFTRLTTVPEFQNQYSVEVTAVGSNIITVEVALRSALHNPGCVVPQCKGCKKQKTRKGKQLKWTFVDSVRLLPMKLDEAMQALGIGRKVEIKISYNDLAKQKNNELMRDYLRVDCVGLHKVLTKMQNIVGGLGGQLGATLPATAMDIFRRKYQWKDIHTNRHFAACPEDGKTDRKPGERPGCGHCLHKFSRRSLFGGRTEIYRMHFLGKNARDTFDAKEIGITWDKFIKPHLKADGTWWDKGHESAKVYDVNSHYPACMLEHMPVGPSIEVEGLTESAVYDNAKTMVGIVDCDVYIPEDCYLPPLPVRLMLDRDGKQKVNVSSSDKGKLIFPTGHFSGTWDACELALLPQVGGKILRARRSVWFETSLLFGRFIYRMYQFRDKTKLGYNDGLSMIGKLMMNSLFGKWAMKEERSKIIFDAPREDIVSNRVRCLSMVADLWIEDVWVSPTYIIPQISVHVTALARMKLWKLMKDVLDRGGRIYYCDTDSIVVSGVDMPSGSGLGDLKLEATVNRAEFTLPKLYLLDTAEPKRLDKSGKAVKKKEAHLTIRSKGFGPGIRMTEGDDPYAGEMSGAEWFDLVHLGIPLSRYRLTKLRENLAKAEKELTTFPRVVSSPKQISSDYDKRHVLPTYDTAPLHLQS